MKRQIRLGAKVIASVLGCLSARSIFVQARMVSFLIVLGGLVEAEDTVKARVIELKLSPASLHAARDDLAALPSIDNMVMVLSQGRTQGEFPRQRNAELSSQHLVIVAVDAKGEEISRTVMLDPRVLRAETTESSGQFTSSELLYRKNVTFSVTIPDDARAFALRIQKPRWTGDKFALDLIGEAILPERGRD
jgi:hypothetical protein